MNIRNAFAVGALVMAMAGTAHASYFYDLSDTVTVDLDRVSAATYRRMAVQNSADFFQIDVHLADGTTQFVTFELDHEADAKKAWHELRNTMQNLNGRKK